MKTELLHPKDEKEWAHSCHRISNIYLHTFLLATLFLSLGLIFASKEMIVPKDNWVKEFYDERQEFVNSSIVTFDEVIQAIDPDHFLHKLHIRRFLRYNFGTTLQNHCNIFPYPKGINFPSLLRRMTFSAGLQICFRTAVLISITVRLFCVLCRCHDIRSKIDSHCFYFLTKCCLLSELLTCTSGMFLTALHLERDQSMSFLLNNSLLIFGISFLVNGSLYALLESCAKDKKFTRIRERCICLVLFAGCFPFVNQSYTSFLLSNPCMIYVPQATAICEYTCMTCILIYYMTQYEDYKKLEIVLSTTKLETMCCLNYAENRDDYYPAMLHDFENTNPSDKRSIESYTDKPIYKSVIFVS